MYVHVCHSYDHSNVHGFFPGVCVLIGFVSNIISGFTLYNNNSTVQAVNGGMIIVCTKH